MAEGHTAWNQVDGSNTTNYVQVLAILEIWFPCFFPSMIASFSFFLVAGSRAPTSSPLRAASRAP